MIPSSKLGAAYYGTLTERGGGNTVSAVITHDSAVRLGLKSGGHVCALFKASSVIIGVN